MTPELVALGRRAVACKAWRWMAGMLTIPSNAGEDDEPLRVLFADGMTGETIVSYATSDSEPFWSTDSEMACPDFSDPATLGCLLALAREALGPMAYIAPFQHPDLPGGVKWVMMAGSRQPGIEGPTEAEALVSALECAP